ncbi:MAG: GNAT family N-acetyltransferase [Psychromonas sp.]|nr:GNAT family N-acetyltransferase [Psychromonas sp.]
MDFSINTADSLDISDQELSQLLLQVYVGGGFTELKTARSLLNPAAIRERGKIIGARDKTELTLAGIVIVVSPNSSAGRFAHYNESEMHLLGVKTDYRRHGLGRQLVKSAIDEATQEGYSKMLLWTQSTMNAAHCLYKKSGFVRTNKRDFQRNGREFWFYERALRQQLLKPDTFLVRCAHYKCTGYGRR